MTEKKDGKTKEIILDDKRPLIKRDDLPSPLRYLVIAISIAFSLYIIYTSGFGAPEAYLHRTYYVTFIMPLIFLCMPAYKRPNEAKIEKWIKLGIDIILALGAFYVGFYIVSQYPAIYLRFGRATPADIRVAILLAVLVVEAGRRSVGIILPLIAITLTIYTFMGPSSPFLPHAGIMLRSFAAYILIGTSGIFGTVTGAMATYIAIFIIFAAFLASTGANSFFLNVANAGLGHRTGGPAKSAVAASGLMGMLSGAAVANVAATGSFTIPLMKNKGYEPTFAAAVEAAASTGGQFMPPIMGASAFIISAYTGIPYYTIVAAAIIPATMYFLSIGFIVHFRAVKLGLTGLPKSELPTISQVMRKQGILVFPVLALIYFLARGYTPMYAGFYAMVSLLIVVNFMKDTRLTPYRVYESLVRGAQGCLVVSGTVFVAELAIINIIYTGLAMRLTTFLVGLSGGNLLYLMFFTMISSLILGMGLPTVACYVLVSIVVAPALVELGVAVIQAHLFVFFFGIMANVTPPIAIAAFAAAGIADSNPFKTGVQAFKLALAAFLIPYIFVYDKAFLAMGPWYLIAAAAFKALIAAVLLAAGVEGVLLRRFKPVWFWSPVLIMTALLVLVRNPWADIAGFGIFIGILIWQWRSEPDKVIARKAKKTA